MIRSDWTPEETEALKLHRANGLSAGQIAKLIPGRSRNSVLGRVMRLGLDKLDPHKCRYPNGAQSTKKRYPPKPKPIVVEPLLPEIEFLLDGHRITMETIRNGMCRYPHGEGAAIWFCGNSPKENSPYCAAHHKLSHQPFREGTRVSPRR